jgi:hypothetical protein
MNSPALAAGGQLLAPGSSYMASELERLFEHDSPLLR